MAIFHPVRECHFSDERLQGLVKSIPGVPEGKTPIHLVEKPIYKPMQK